MKFRPASFLLFIALAVVVCMSSCIKNYTCHCDIKYTGAPGLPDSTSQEYDIKDTKSNAKSKCTSESGNYTNNYVNTSETCYLY